MKKVWTLVTIALVFSLTAAAWGEKGTPLTEWFGQQPNATDGVKASWTNSTLWTGTATLRKLSIVTQVKGAGDDTIRLFTNQSAAPRHTFLLSDTSTSSGTAMANRWRKDLIDSTGSGFTAAAAYDINADGYTDMFAGRTATPYRLKRYYWTGTGWNTDTTAATLPGAINDMAVGDADNDGNADDIIATSGQVVFHVHWNGAGFDTTRIWAGDASTCYGVAIGDFDADHTGNEVVAVTYGQRVMRLVWSGASWDTTTLFLSPNDLDLYEVAIGDFDASSPGAEIAVGNGYLQATYGSVLEVYGSGSSWNVRALYTSAESVRELAIGDFLDENPGDEIVIAPYTSPYNVRAIYGSGTTWAQQLMFTTGGTSYGAAVGNVDKYRANNDEVAITGNSRVFEAAQYWPANDLAITAGGPLSYPFVTDEPESIWVRVKNPGTNNQPSFDLNFYINGASYSSVAGLSLNAGDSLDVVLPFTVSGADAAVNFTVYHSLSPDETPANDTLGTMDPIAGLTRRFHDWIFPANTYKAEGFEYLASYPPAGWARINNDGGTQQWGWFTSTTNPRQMHSGRLFTANRYESSSLRNDDWLVTDAVTLPADPDDEADSLSFYYRVSNFGQAESLEVWAMTGQSINDTVPGGILWAAQYSDTIYGKKSISLAQFAGQTIFIGFRNRGLYMWYNFLDDIHFGRFTVPPTITYTSPADGATDVLVNAPLVIAFSEPIDASTYSGFFTPDPAGWDSSWNATMDTITWTHNDYATSTLHTYQVLTANDLNGNPLAAGPVPNPFTFTTNADGTPPTASVVSPAWGATDVALNEPVVIAFSEPMNTGSINGYSTPTDPWSISFNAAGDTMTLTPDTLLSYNSLYHVIATAGTDLAGYNLVPLPDTIAQFTTMANQGPNIEMVLQPGDTYDGNGPFTVRAVITDPAKAGIAADTLWYTNNVGAWNYVAHSAVNADTFDFSIPGPFPAGTLVEYFIGAWDDQGDVTWEPDQWAGHQFRILDPLAPTALEATAGDMMVQLDWAPPVQNLNYATAEMYVWGFSVGDIADTRFTPQHYPCKLEQTTALWFGTPGLDSIEVHVWPDNGTGIPDLGTDLVPPFKVMPLAYPSVTVVDFSSYNLVLTSGDFHIGYVCLTADMPRPITDGDAPGQHTMYYMASGTSWGQMEQSPGIYVDLNHTAVVSYAPYTKGLALKSYVPRKTDKPLPTLAGLKANPITSKQAVQYPELKGALAMAKNIVGTEILRGDAPGGPYTTSLGTTTNVSLIDASVSNGSTYYYVARAVYSAPDTFSAFSNEDTASPAGMPILLVDDDGQVVGNPTWIDGQPYYTAALDGAGYTGQYSVFEKEWGVDGPAAAWYQGRDAVIWFTSYNWNGNLSANDMTNLAGYLDAGGKLFLCGQDVLYYTGLNTFTQNYLGVQAATQDGITANVNLAGMAGSLAEGYSYALSNTAAIPELYGDDLTAIAGAGYVFDVTAKVGEKPAVQYDNGTFRSVFFAFPFENLVDGANTKTELMYRVLNWLNTGVEGNPAADAKPTVFSLASNYPNPVRTSTTIKFGLPKDSDVRIEVFNIAGQKVKTLASGKLNAGYHTVNWRGANENGQKVAAGVYLVRMVTPEFTGTRKMTVLR